MRGFTALAERLTPEALSTSLAAFRKAVSDAARRCGGMVDKFIGDGALVVFGALDGDRASAGADAEAWREVSREPLRGRCEGVALYAPLLAGEAR